MMRYARGLLLLLGMSLMIGCASQNLKAGKQDFDAKNYSAAFQKMLPLAEKGNAHAQYAVGYMLYYGKGVEVNRKQGVAWIDKAADQGLPEAKQAQQMLAAKAPDNPLDTQ